MNKLENSNVRFGRIHVLLGTWQHAIASVTMLTLCIPAANAQVPTDPFNYSRTTTFTYDVNTGRVATETIEPNNAPSCVLTTFGYDAYGNRTSVTTTNCPGAAPAASFTSRTVSKGYVAPVSQTISVADNNNLVSAVSVSYPSGLVATTASNGLHNEGYQYDPRFGAALRLTGPNGLVTTWSIDDFGRTVKETHADTTSTVTLYCILSGGGRDVSSNAVSCPTPVAAEVPADAVAFVHSEPRRADGTRIGAFSRIYTDRLGRSIRSATESFDGAGQPSARSGAVVVQDTVYAVSGAKIIETQPYFLASGSSTTGGTNNVGASLTTYDVLGRPTVVYTSNPSGQAGSLVFGSGGAVSYGAYGSQTAAAIRFAYAGLTSTTTNDKGQVHVEEKNVIGEVVRVTDDSHAQLAYQRDAFGNLLVTKDALQNTINLVYDIRGRKTQMSDPDAGVFGYCYDALGQLKAQQNSIMRGNNTPGACPATNNGITATSVAGWTTLAYDQLGRTTQRVEPEYTTTWSYDQYADGSPCFKGKGRLCQVVISNGLNRKLVYDGKGRPASSLVSTGTGPSFASAVSYDSNTGRIASETYPTGLRVGYAYTARGYIAKLSLLTPATVTPLAAADGSHAASTNLAANSVLWQAQVVNAWGATERHSYGNGVIANAAYQAATGRATALTAGAGTSTTVLNHHYTWDSLSNLTGRSDANGDGGSGAVSETFTYGDRMNRLTSYTVAAPAIPNLSRTVDMRYNALGMLLYKSDVGYYSYGTQGPASVRPHAMQSVFGAVNGTNGFDANGNLTSASTGKYRSIAYTSFNLPDSQNGLAGPGGLPRHTWQYDDTHARVKEVRVNAAGTRTTWYMHPDNQGGLGFEREDNSNGGSSNRHFLSAGGQAIGVLVSTAALPSLSVGQTVPPSLGSVTLVKVEYWHKDHLGSLAATTDHTGAVTARYAYDPFGKRRYTNGSYDAAGNLAIDWSPTSNSGTARGFTGHENLDDTGLVHMNGRIFDPTLAVFLQADPSVTDPGDLQSFNRYGYCRNNPMTCTDPTGFVDGYQPDGSFYVTIIGYNNPYDSPNMTGGGTYPGASAIYDYSAANAGANASLNATLAQQAQLNAQLDANFDAMWAQINATLDARLVSPPFSLPSHDIGIWVSTEPTSTPAAQKYAPPSVTQASSGFAAKGAAAPAGAVGAPGVRPASDADIDRATGWAAVWAADKVDDFNRSEPGRMLQGMLPGEAVAAGGLKAGLLWLGRLTKAETVAAKGGLTEARAARDALSAELAGLKGKAPATVTGGYNVNTGEVAARACGGGKCAENHVVDALGGAKGNVRFTEAVRPRTGAEVPVCPRCEATFGREPFPRNTRFKTDE